VSQASEAVQAWEMWWEPASWELVVWERVWELGLIRTTPHHNRSMHSRSRRTNHPQRSCQSTHLHSNTWAAQGQASAAEWAEVWAAEWAQALALEESVALVSAVGSAGPV